MASFTVSLKDCPNSTEEMRAVAELKFIKALEGSFPDPVTMLAAYKIWQDASEGGSGLTLTKADVSKAQKFQSAYEKACAAGLMNMRPSEDTYFDLRLA